MGGRRLQRLKLDEWNEVFDRCGGRRGKMLPCFVDVRGFSCSSLTANSSRDDIVPVELEN